VKFLFPFPSASEWQIHVVKDLRYFRTAISLFSSRCLPLSFAARTRLSVICRSGNPPFFCSASTPLLPSTTFIPFELVPVRGTVEEQILMDYVHFSLVLPCTSTSINKNIWRTRAYESSLSGDCEGIGSCLCRARSGIVLELILTDGRHHVPSCPGFPVNRPTHLDPPMNLGYKALAFGSRAIHVGPGPDLSTTAYKHDDIG